MSDYINADIFEAGKKAYKEDPQNTFKLHMALRDAIDHPGSLSRQDVGDNCAVLSLLDLSLASVEAKKGDGFSANLFFKEAREYSRRAHESSSDTIELDKILQKVSLEIPEESPKRSK